jgi:predicted HicB family RNase H-like nuclease
VFGGTVVKANVLMSFEGKTVAERRKSLCDVVDAYLERRALLMGETSGGGARRLAGP